MKPTSIFVSLQAFAFALAIALPAPQDEKAHGLNLDLIRVELVGDPMYAISGCRKYTNACHFTNVIIFCDPATPCSSDYAQCTVWLGQGHGKWANCM